MQQAVNARGWRADIAPTEIGIAVRPVLPFPIDRRLAAGQRDRGHIGPQILEPTLRRRHQRWAAAVSVAVRRAETAADRRGRLVAVRHYRESAG